MPQQYTYADFESSATFGPFDTAKVLVIQASGAQGGGFIGFGTQGGVQIDKTGKGGVAKGKITLAAGRRLLITVGEGGPWTTPPPTGAINNVGGAGSGGQGTYYGYPGGGATIIDLIDTDGVTSISKIFVVGGGGGGSGVSTGARGGDGGGPDGAAGLAGTGGGGGGATPTTGGTGGSNGGGGTGNPGGAGVLGAGGDGGDSTTAYYGAGGGGGGYYGGGGGGAGTSAVDEEGGGGGGGSTKVDTALVSEVEMIAGAAQGHGTVHITVYEAAPIAPSTLIPFAGATVADDTPQFGAYIQTEVLGTQYLQGKVRVEWQVAQDQNFTSNLKVITQPTTALKYGGPTAPGILTVMDMPSGQRLPQGVWYMRARCIDWNGTSSDWSPVQSFTVSSAPTVSELYPTGDKTIQFLATGVQLSWTYSSTNFGAQSAFQVNVETAAGALLHDTGKVISYQKLATVLISAANKNQALRWRVKVWDVDDVEGEYSSYSLFRVGDLPQVVIEPIGIIATPNPIVTWEQTPGGGVPLKQKRLYITRDSDGALIYDSGWV